MKINEISKIIILDDKISDVDENILISRIKEIFYGNQDILKCIIISEQGTKIYNNIANNTQNCNNYELPIYGYKALFDNNRRINEEKLILLSNKLKEYCNEENNNKYILLFDYVIQDNSQHEHTVLQNLFDKLREEENLFSKENVKIIGYSSWTTEACDDFIENYKRKYSIINLYHLFIDCRQSCDKDVKYTLVNEID